MRFNFIGDISTLENGISIFSGELGFETSVNGLSVRVEKSPANSIEVTKKEGSAHIRYSEKIHFFRALGLLVEALGEMRPGNLARAGTCF